MNDLTPEELAQLRNLILESERASWAWKKIRIIVPAAVGVMVALWQLWEWGKDHLRFH